MELSDAQIDHVGIVVHSLDGALATYCGLLGFRLLERIDLPAHGVEVAFLETGDSTLELLSPTDEDGGTARTSKWGRRLASWRGGGKASITSASQWRTSGGHWRSCGRAASS